MPKKPMPAAERQQETSAVMPGSPPGALHDWPDTGPGARARKRKHDRPLSLAFSPGGGAAQRIWRSAAGCRLAWVAAALWCDRWAGSASPAMGEDATQVKGQTGNACFRQTTSNAK